MTEVVSDLYRGKTIATMKETGPNYIHCTDIDHVLHREKLSFD